MPGDWILRAAWWSPFRTPVILRKAALVAPPVVLFWCDMLPSDGSRDGYEEADCKIFILREV